MCVLLDDNSIVADPSSPVKSVACETMSLPPPHVVQEVEHYQSQDAKKEQEVTQVRPPMCRCVWYTNYYYALCTAGSTGEHKTPEQDSKARSTHQAEGTVTHSTS